MRELLRKAKLGDKRAKELIIIACKPLIIKSYMSINIKNFEKEDIEQICVMVVLNVIEKIDLEKERLFFAYLKRSINNKLIDLKKRCDKNIIYIDNKELSENRMLKVETLEEEVLKREVINRLKNIVLSFSKDERILFEMVYINGEKLTSYADFMGINYSDAYKMKVKIRKSISSYYMER
ncbi:sigma-70 family RNA polymerase sigma factor [Clostridium septicum]|uniref:Sigma-70 family RNA polymerase sigma factor n=1 Tax=Clostridium septicum TaxID=1504 RepID=A0A9N7PKD3_CLOSE|nr:sigma-70 family RNA polymerase sigma factor [Clostridium septicum]AYE33897.1 sigma-70 family RNA polymerase sigma factor [Clostridium septicum]MDU1312953.1 sigma-70 family RNA polymerase sigma factor [Clostridium septicum]QAS62048.1 sigma-70 family RNA polymerase sigma factor [Clostridium septicum]UEC21496.1 sigma-70 family RNA polymerase sigma factor [Clostridium septicum]USS00457.1 sigma-70 family RNA polymerase sigma factor [Clostridium septicum]